MQARKLKIAENRIKTVFLSSSTDYQHAFARVYATFALENHSQIVAE